MRRSRASKKSAALRQNGASGAGRGRGHGSRGPMAGHVADAFLLGQADHRRALHRANFISRQIKLFGQAAPSLPRHKRQSERTKTDHDPPIANILPVAPDALPSDGRVDEDGMRRVIDCMIDQGVDAICILANYFRSSSCPCRTRSRHAAYADQPGACRLAGVPVIVTNQPLLHPGGYRTGPKLAPNPWAPR